jgi:PAS domain S-box-containing protein
MTGPRTADGIVDLDLRLVQRLRRASRALCVGVVALGMLVLLSWAFGVPELKVVDPSFATMRANTALSFVLLGIGLWAAPRSESLRLRRAAAFGVSSIAALTLTEYSLGVDLGMDGFFRTEKLDTLHGDRSAPVTALNFLFLGMALLLLDRGMSRRSSDAAVLLASAISFVAFCGYLYDAPSLYRIGPHFLIAFPTTLGFFACAAAFLASRPDEGVLAILTSDTTAGMVLRRMLPWIAIAPLALGWAAMIGERAGLYDAALEFAILTCANAGILVAAISLVAASLRTSELERRRAEAAVGTSERRLRQVVEGSPFAVAMLDRGMRYLFASRRWLSDFRIPFTNEQIPGRSHYEMFPEIPERWKEIHRRCLGGESARSDGEAFVRGDGTVDWTRWEIRPWTDDAGEIGGILMFSEDIGIRKREELELKRWEHVFQNAAWGMALATPDDRCIVVNRAFAEMHGTKAEDWPGRPLAEMLAEESRPMLPDLERRLEETGHVTYEAMHARAEGSKFPVLTAVSALKDEQGRILFRAMSCQDVTDRHRSELRFRMALEAAPTGMLMVDGAGRITLVNAALEKLFGYTREELLGKPSQMLLAERLRTRHVERRTAFFRDPADRPIGADQDLYGLCKDGREIPIDVGFSPLQMPDGTLVLASVVDVSERKRAEKERAELLRQREEARLHAERSRFFELSLDLVCIASTEGRFLQLSPSFSSTLGYSLEELLTSPFFDFVHPDDLPATREELSRLSGGALTRDFRNRYRCKNGSYRWLQWRCRPDADGRIYGVARDVTRDAALVDELRRKQESLGAALKEREVLLQEIHHRVKNNLQIMSSLINMQVRQMRDTSAIGALHECRTRIEAIALIHEKLYQSSDYARVPFAGYARSLARAVLDASASPIALKFDVDLIDLPVDRAMACGLILNELITNALKHAFPGDRGGTISVELRESDGEAILAVTDDGVGLPPGFDPTASNSLGMQLVMMLAEQIEGHLDLARVHGTRVQIAFPMEATS